MSNSLSNPCRPAMPRGSGMIRKNALLAGQPRQVSDLSKHMSKEVAVIGLAVCFHIQKLLALFGLQ